MSTNPNSNPLGNRGKAAEDDWARRRDAEAIDKMKKEQGGKPGSDAPASGAKPAEKSKKGAKGK